MKTKTFAEKVIDFNNQLAYNGPLPKGFQVINPFVENKETKEVMQKFYYKYYNDFNPRIFILGINPSRHGAGVTGVPFTDTKRLENVCGIKMQSAHTHEISSVFLYDMIEAYGGAKKFYQKFYINSPFPLAIVQQAKDGKHINANYYDSPILFGTVKDFMIESLKKQMSIGLQTKDVFVLGKKNETFIQKLNKQEHLFSNIHALEHPRYIQQYKSKEKLHYIDKYIITLNQKN